ncbi:oxidoreductase [Microbacterium nanhaiense]|uniref:Oxidoreductase n=1 Tax=Microbacterium nanhaiense TaxID=1301026 RepID=A0ABQ2N3K2_9MICO|nr:aldo/keto reductase [Microbacterium nanhaiense]GGO67140.1 oxidoreductase [Microbacterium nanhaiense]
MSPEPIALPELGYGAANLGNLFRVLADDEAHEVLEAAWDAGIRLYDTAPHYGLGLSERRLGAFLRTKPRDEYVLTTKAGRLIRPNADDDGGLDLANDFHVRADVRREWDFSAAGIRRSLEESRERLGIERVDVLYLHDPERHDLDEAITRALPALENLRDAGVVGAVGVGSMVTGALARTVEESRLDVVMIAGRYTLLEQPAAVDVLPACRRTGTSAVAASVFNSGLLSRAEPARDDRYEYGAVPDEVWDCLQLILAVCRAHDVPLPAAALQYPLRDAVVRSVVVGAWKPEQIRQNVELARFAIPEDFWGELASEGLIPRPTERERADA